MAALSSSDASTHDSNMSFLYIFSWHHLASRIMAATSASASRRARLRAALGTGLPLHRTPPPRAGAADLPVLSIEPSDSAMRRRHQGFTAARVQRERGRKETDVGWITETSAVFSFSICFVR
jgi:hypothetical protein